MSDQQSVWASIREKLSLEELLHLDNAIGQFNQEIEAHEQQQHAPTYDPDGELKRVDVQIIAGSGDQVAYTNESVKQFIEKRLLIAWTALKNADHLNDLAAPNLTINQTENDAAMDIIGQCVEEINGLNTATTNGDAAII